MGNFDHWYTSTLVNPQYIINLVDVIVVNVKFVAVAFEFHDPCVWCLRSTGGSLRSVELNETFEVNIAFHFIELDFNLRLLAARCKSKYQLAMGVCANFDFLFATIFEHAAFRLIVH